MAADCQAYRTTARIVATPSEPLAGAIFRSVSPAVIEVNAWNSTSESITPCGIGSCFVADNRGHLLTSYHLLAQVNTVQIHFPSGEERMARVLGIDPQNDLAVLSVDLPANITAVPLGDADTVQAGDVAIAIGHPFGLEGSVTQGIFSALHREWQAKDGIHYQDLIQTDAPIHPCNSGGPLLNVRGDVIGMTISIQSPVEGNVGIGFAVPINQAKLLLQAQRRS